MNEHHYQRIDKGINRKEARRIRQESRQQPVSEQGTYLSQYSVEARQNAINDALIALQAGEPTNQIAARHNLPGRTLRSWLIVLPEADQARALMISNELSHALEEIENAQDPMPLARARELFRGWAWLGERRLPQYFGQKQEVTHLHADLGDRLRRARERVIEGQHTSVMLNTAPNEIKGLEDKQSIHARDPKDSNKG